MSFYINNNNTCRPGGLSGNPSSGLCEKALIEVTKVFDACRQQMVETGLTLALTDLNPASPTLPLTFISATTLIDNPATISDVIIDRIEQRPNFANVTGTVTVPIQVNYRDANGTLGVANSTIGSINAEGNTATVTGCLNIILKISAKVDILVPSYGYPVIPPCRQAETQICPGTGDLPLFPTAINNS